METAPQDDCPYNHKFARELSEPSFAARSVIPGKEVSTRARELLAMSQSEFSTAFKGSPMKRVRRRGLKRNSAVVPANLPDERAVRLSRRRDA